MKLSDLKVGDKFGMLTYLSECEKITLPCGQKNRVALCRCDCGNEKKVRMLHMLRSSITNCGCLHPRHGMSFSHLYGSWRAMVNRCKPDYFQKQYYFDKGIAVCDKWKSGFTNFKDWSSQNGYKEGLQIDRIDNSKGYYPENCRWSTQEENLANRDLTVKVLYNGLVQPFMAICHEKGMTESRASVIRARINRGWMAQRAFDTPIRTGKYITKLNPKSYK